MTGSCALSFLQQTDRLPVQQVYTVRQDVLAIAVENGEVNYAEQLPYQPQPGDQRPTKDDQLQPQVQRNGQTIGTLIGKDEDILYTYDRVEGEFLSPNWADRTSSYQIVSRTDPAYRQPMTPTAVYRKTRPTDWAQTGPNTHEWPLEHRIYLQLPTDLTPGNTYDVQFQDGRLQNITFDYQPQSIRSEAVHVSQIGFRPDDPAKVAFLSLWMGNGGSLGYPNTPSFSLVDEATDQAVYTGQAQLTHRKDAKEDPRDRDYTLTDVYTLDFSEFNQPGEYRVCVDTVGCSFSFPIEMGAWQQAFITSTRGLYHQRSGIELSPPYTTVKRPRPFHPDDGVVVYQSDAKLMDTNMGIGEQNAFAALLEGKTNEVVPNAWGGYFDAGDWDRRIQHLQIPRLLFELAEQFPTQLSSISLNIPESDNALPDVIDEALWSLDFFKRLQTPDGGIRGGIETAEHPEYGETSWQSSLDVMAYAPDIWSSYMYAGVAARAAHWLQSRQPDLAAEYQDSAQRAMAYAEQVYQQEDYADDYRIRDERNLAAVELYRLTGDNLWHGIFLETTVYTDADVPTREWRSHDQRDAAYVYAQLEPVAGAEAIHEHAYQALLREADQLVKFGQDTAFRWVKTNPYAPIGWGQSIGTPQVLPILRAHALTQDDKYLKAALLGTQFVAGANPQNLVYTTGLGQQSVQHPNAIDQRVIGEPPPPGITVFGPLDLTQFGDYWTVQLFEDETFPDPREWPTAEAYFDVYKFLAATEFTVMDTIAPTAYTWGYLAIRG
ncbi:MAG: glycoside hydrolase family 9 protein [Thainema sp.]